MKTRNNPQMALRRWEVASLPHQQGINAAIARPMKTAQKTVCRELADRRNFGRDDLIHVFEDIGSAPWSRIDLMEADAWGTGERSPRRLHTGQITLGKMGDSICSRWPDRHGDLQFLVTWCAATSSGTRRSVGDGFPKRMSIKSAS